MVPDRSAQTLYDWWHHPILFQVRSWNSGYRQFSVVWHVWYFVQFEWHIHNIKVLYLSFLHERNIKISFDIGLRLLPDYVRDLMFLCYLSVGFQIHFKAKECLVSQTLCNNEKGNNSKCLKFLYLSFFEFLFCWEDLKERINVIAKHQLLYKQQGVSRWWKKYFITVV